MALTLKCMAIFFFCMVQCKNNTTFSNGTINDMKEQFVTINNNIFSNMLILNVMSKTDYNEVYN